MKKIKPVKGYAAVWMAGPSGKMREEICEVSFYRESLQQNLRHIRVIITPIHPRKKHRKRRVK